jgi:iron-sulfur cluster assembly protein
MNITITDKAKKALIQKDIGTENFLRVKIIEGGCAGLTYTAEIAQDMQTGEDVVFQLDEIRLVADSDSAQYLDGLNIDFSDDLISGGLRFTNEKTVSTCGCGASFNLSGFPVIEEGQCSK